MIALLARAVLVCALALPLFAAGYNKTLDFRAATPEELAMTSVAFAPGASAVVLDWARADDDMIALSSEYFRIKVFTDEGKKYGDVEVPYFPAYPLFDRITDLEARTIQPDGKIVPFTGKVYDKVVYKAGRSALKAKAFSIQNVQPGSIIEYRYTKRWSENVLLDTTWAIQRDLPVVRARFSLRPYGTTLRGSRFNTFFTFSGLPAGKKPERNGDQWTFAMENIPAFVSEEFAPPESELKPNVRFYYSSSIVPPQEFWSAQAVTFAKEISSFLGKGGQSQAKEWTAGANEPLAKLKQIYAKVQSMSNLSYGAEDAKVKEAKNAADVLAANAGYRDELNRAFVAVARAAGFDANVVRVAPRDDNFFSNNVPDAGQMDAEIVVVAVDGKPLFLDPGTPNAPFGVVSWEKSNVPAILINREGKPEWVKVPGTTPADAQTRRKADLKMNGDTLEGTVTVTFTGQEALIRRLRDHGEDEAARKKALEEEVKEWLAEGTTVALQSVTGYTASDDALVATFNVAMPNAVSRAGSRVIVPVSIFAANAANPFAPTTRTHPIYYEYPKSESDEVKVTLGSGMTVATVPPPSKLNAGALRYTSEAKATASEVTFTRSMSVDTMLVEAKYYNALRNFYSAMVAADQKPLVLTVAQ